MGGTYEIGYEHLTFSLEFGFHVRSANQFRALEEDEVQFLDSIVMEQRRKEKLREEEDSVEVKSFKQ